MSTASGSDKLTQLLTALFDWLEASNPEMLYYGNVPLRAAFERYFYFEAASNPERLAPLLDVTQQWRRQNQFPAQSAIYDEYLKEKGGFARRVRNRGLIWLRLIRDFLNHRRSKRQAKVAQKIKSHTHLTIGFFAINERFIHFFAPIASHFKQENTVYFSPIVQTVFHPDSKEVWASDKSCKVVRTHLTLSLTNSLFPEYLRLCFFYERIASVLRYWQPDVLLFAEGTSHYDELASQAAKLLGIQTIRVQSGRAGILHSGYRKMSFDHMLCWGGEFVNRYQSVSPSPHYHITGSPLIDEFVQLTNTAHVVADEKKRILIITQPISRHIKESDYLELIDIARQLLDKREDIHILVRQHPVDQHDGFGQLANLFQSRVELMNSPTYSLAEVFVKADCAIGFFSTVISEAAACGIIPITLQNRHVPSVYPYPEKRGAAILVSNKKEAVDKALDVLDNRSQYHSHELAMKQFSTDFFGSTDVNALVKTVSLIKNVAQENSSFVS